MGFFDIGDEARKEFPNWDYGKAFAYLWRRFGPPETGWDGYKQLVAYYLTTKIEGLYLTCSPFLDEATCSFGFMFDKATIGTKIAADLSKPKEEWSNYTKSILSALCDAMRELKRPTNVRDWFINIEGHVKDEDIEHPIEYNIRAGFGIGSRIIFADSRKVATTIKCNTDCKYNLPFGVCRLKRIKLKYLPGQKGFDVWCRNYRAMKIKSASQDARR